MIKDQYGLIASRTWTGEIDGGDTLAETGRIYFLKELCDIEDDLIPFWQTPLLLTNDKGEWRRTPSGQWSDPKDVSRDQLDPMIMCLQIHQRRDRVKSEFWRIVGNWFRYPNGDVASPEHLGHLSNRKNLFAILCKNYWSDTFLFINTCIICFFTGSDSRYVANDLNHQISLCYSEYFRPTFISRFAGRIYLTKRPYGYKWALEEYYKPETGNADLIEYYNKGMKWLSKRLF